MAVSTSIKNNFAFSDPEHKPARENMVIAQSGMLFYMLVLFPSSEKFKMRQEFPGSMLRLFFT